MRAVRTISPTNPRRLRRGGPKIGGPDTDDFSVRRPIQQANLLHMVAQPVSQLAAAPEDQAAVARLFSVLADPTRVALLELLLIRPRTVRELVEATGAPRGRVSNHLACLRWCGFATSERSGRAVTYRVADRRVQRVLRQGRELADERAEHLASCQRIGPDWI